MRAPGEAIGMFAVESAIDELAYELQMDPIEVRRINEPPKDPTRDTPFSSRHLTEAYRLGAEAFGWKVRKPGSQRDGKWLVGQGTATAYYPFLRFPAKARVRLCADGSAVVQTPASDMGMGTATAQIQHAADRLGLPMHRVNFQYGDFSLPDTPIFAGGSNQTASNLCAVRGGIIMGIGMALTEETLFDERRGRIMNPSLAEYHVPVNMDVPHIDIIYTGIPDEHAPLGARGIGEIGITGAAAAVANAVFNATGKRIRDLPITLDKLL